MPAGTTHIVFAEPFDAEAVERMESIGSVTVLDSCDEETLKRAVGDCDALLVRGTAKVTRSVLLAASRLRVIGRGGVGLENIDLDTARQRGVRVVYTPAAATEAVADLTVALMLALLRDIAAGDASVRAGRFREARNRAHGRELESVTVGIIGLGRIGRAVARRCRHGFETPILYNDIVRPGPLDFDAVAVEKSDLYARADIVSLHVPLTDKTQHLIDGQALGEFKPGSFLINTSRGAVVDGEALARALRSGRIAGAALDVFDPEPLPAGHPLLKAPNTLLTPHIGARTNRGLAGMNAVVEDVERVLAGESPLYEAGG